MTKTTSHPDNSSQLFARACRRIPGGVNSPVRAFKSVGGTPVYLASGSGSKIHDVDGREYVDFCGSWGPLVLGHAHPEVVAALQKTASLGLSFGACHPLEVEMAELLGELLPHMEMVRLVNSGTEAVMTALRLARAFTGRNRILKFDGCYHGHADSLLTAAGSGLLTNAIPASAGVSAKAVAEVVSIPYNDPSALEAVFEKHGGTLAAAIVEPVAGNMGLVEPQPGFLERMRDLCSSHGACLIFDEVITGFRFRLGSYADSIGIVPDIGVFGKIIGGGMPVGAVAGREAIMRLLSPEGPVYQAGTLSGNPVALAAGIATLNALRKHDPYARMAELAALFAERINRFAAERGVAAHCVSLGSVFTLFFSALKPLRNLEAVKSCDARQYAGYFHFMLERGFYLPPSQFELNFVSAAHSEKEIIAAATAATDFLGEATTGTAVRN